MGQSQLFRIGVRGRRLESPHESECDVARLKPCPSFITATREHTVISTAPMNRGNLLFFGQVLF